METETTEFPLSDITLDQRLQPRAALDAETVEDYAARYSEGADMPAVTLFHDGTTFWLADGFTRVAAARKAGRDTIPATVCEGTFHDALLFAAAANAAHGLRRSNADKRRAVGMLLADAECAGWPDREIARHCQVNHHLVAEMRAALSGSSPRYEGGGHLGELPDTPTTRPVTRNGKTYMMNVSRIGKHSGAPSRTREGEKAGEGTPPETKEHIRDRVLNELADGITNGHPHYIQWLDSLNSCRRDGALARYQSHVPNCRACRDNEGGDQPFKRSIALTPSVYTNDRAKADGPDLVFCPFCGENYGFAVKTSEESEGPAVITCNGCGAVGPLGSDVENAKTLWNARC